MADNPGTVLASAVDAEMAKLRQLQGDLQKLQQDLQTVLGQQAENDMVLEELRLLDPDDTVYKQVGPVMLQHNVEEAKDTVQKRLEFIAGEKKKIEGKMQSKQNEGEQLAGKIQKMQKGLQETTAEAVRAIAAHHAQG